MPNDPIPLRPAGQVPILGQPAELLSFVPTVLLRCNCEGKHPLLAVGMGAIVQCPGCAKRFTLKAFVYTPDRGLSAELGLVVSAPIESPLVPAGTAN